MSIFKIATREKYRFQFRGLISTEDLWDLPLESLDAIFKDLNSQLKQVKEESLLEQKTKEDKELDTKIEIIKHIVNVKLEERNTRLRAKQNKEEKEKILKIIANKQDADLENKSIEELTKMVNELNS